MDFIDCCWYNRDRIAFHRQAEWTERMYRSIVSIGEAIPDDDRVFRFLAIADERAALLQQKLERSAPLSDIVRRRGWRFVKWRPLRGFLANGAAGLDGLEAVLGLEPAVEQRGHQLVFKW